MVFFVDLIQAYCSFIRFTKFNQIQSLLSSPTENFGGLLKNFLQLGSVPAGYGPFQISLGTLGCGAGHLLYHKLSRETRSAEDDDVVGPVG